MKTILTVLSLLMIVPSAWGQKKDAPKKEPPKYETIRELDKRGKEAVEKFKKRQLDEAVKDLVTLIDKANPEHPDSIRLRYQAIELISQILKIKLDALPEEFGEERGKLVKEIQTWNDINLRTFRKYDQNKTPQAGLQLGSRASAVTDLVRSVQEQWFIEDKKKP